MTKILIVDDEDFIRKGMIYTIPWEENGFSVIEASNGQEAFEASLQHRPDIVLADIQMPVMNGLELAEKLHLVLPNTKIIILTAFGNEENLINAINFKVSAFLIKSACSEKILETVIRIRDETAAYNDQTKKLNHIQQIYTENQPLLKSSLLLRFLHKQISYDHFCRKYTDLGGDVNTLPLSVGMFKVNFDDENYILGQLLFYFVYFTPICFFDEQKNVILILNTSKKELTPQIFEQILPSIQPILFGNFITIMNSITSFTFLPMAYEILNQTLENCFWSKSPYQMIEPTREIAVNDPNIPYHHESQIIKSIMNRDQHQFIAALSSYFQYMEKNLVLRSVFLESVMHILVVIDSIQNTDLEFDKMKDFIWALETPQEILEQLRTLAFPEPTKNCTKVVSDAISYMKEHFTEDLHLEDVANAVYLSPGYLCRIFKRETEHSFIEYLHLLRIEKAKELIERTDYKYYEIAELVGYKNYKYFSAYFNKIAGCSAKFYNTEHLKNGENHSDTSTCIE